MHHAYVIQIKRESGWRYFYRWKNNRLCTAWTLAGAKLFTESEIERCFEIAKNAFDRKDVEVTRVVLCHVELTGNVQYERRGQ